MAVVVLALTVPINAEAASPVLEIAVPGHSLPVPFTTEGGSVNAEMAGFASLVHCTASHGEGEVTGPRAAVAKYAFTGCVAGHGSSTKCKSAGAAEEEIKTGPIRAELVYISEANREVAMLLNPGGGTYMAFECGGESAEGRGPFLAPVGPLNTEASSFTATLSALGATQTPDEYEAPDGEQRLAISEGRHGTNEWVTTGVELTMTVLPSVPGIVKAITAAEVEAKQQQEEAARQHEQKQREDEAAARAASARQYEEAVTAQLKRLNDEVAALRTRLAEEAAAKKKLEETASKPKPTRAQLLAKALHACKKQPKRRRASCEASARRKYRARAA
jgi:hypothetical protein